MALCTLETKKLNREASLGTFTVRRGQRYRATLSLGLLESLADNEMIADRLRGAGFADVKVVGSGATRQAEASWPGDDVSAELPSQITAVTEIEEA
jgi:hypothetical protein